MARELIPRKREGPPVQDLVARARQGQAAAIARLISLVEDDSPALPDVNAALAPHTGRAHIVGLTGSPGVGKSTSTSLLVAGLRRRGKRVAVLAIDPSSPFSGGALLGDRIRMSEHDTDPDVFIRSMASRGHLGGLAGAAPQALRVLDAAGCDVILVETVGVGQAEVEIAGIADTTLVLLAPGMGDGIQAAKAGILEIGDIFVINKADREGANTTRRELRTMLGMRADEVPPGWTPPIVLTVATKGEGADEVVDAIQNHFAYLTESGALTRRRVERARREIEALALASVQRRLGEHAAVTDELAAEVAAGSLDPFAAANRLLHHP
jgi:LAO/AO transport system kinase